MPIPSTKIIGIDWANQNAMRAFPIADGCTEMDTTGSIKLPRDLIVDLMFPVNSSIPSGSSFYVSKVAVFGPGIVITISCDLGEGSVIVGSLSVSKSSHTQNKTYFVIGEGYFVDCVGRITIGSIDETLRLGGVFEFDVSGARLIDTLFPPDIRGVKSITVVNGVEETAKFTGDITLKAGTNFRLRVDEDTKTVFFDALKSTDLNTSCGCDNEVDTPPAIRTINNVPPDSDGNLQLVGDACLEFTSGGEGVLNVNDVCSEPCCGSTELQVIEEDFNTLNQDVRTMRTLMGQIETHLITLDSLRLTVMSSGLLGDNPPRQ